MIKLAGKRLKNNLSNLTKLVNSQNDTLLKLRKELSKILMEKDETQRNINEKNAILDSLLS